MKFWYANTALHDTGRIWLRGDRFEAAESTELVQRHRRFLTVLIDAREDTFAANRDALEQVLTLLRANRVAVLRWTTPDEATTFRNAEARVESYNQLDEGGGGTFIQTLEVVFSWEEDCSAPVLGTTYTALGGEPVNLGEVTAFEASGQSVRPSETDDLRSRIAGRVEMSGSLKAPAGETLATRRASLVALVAALEAAFESKSGTLVHGAFFNRSIRVGEFSARINQAASAIQWRLSATYTRWPSESDFSAAEVSFRTSEDRQGGAVLATLSGTINATSEATAMTKLTALVGSFLTGYAVLGVEAVPTEAHSPDGKAFVRMTYSVEGRKLSGSIVAAGVRVQESEALTDGMVRRVYSGSVTATSGSYAGALAAAQAQVATLGAGKHQFALRGETTYTDSQQSFLRVVTGPFVITAEFSYEYEVRASREYLEYGAARSTDTFGEDSLTVSGFVVAPTLTAAGARYAALKASMASGSFVRNEQQTPRMQEVAATGAPVSSGENLAGGTVSRFARLDFSFVVAVRRVAGQNIAVRYNINTDVDLVTLTRQFSVRGQVGARSRDDAAWAAGQVLEALGVTGADLLSGLVLVRRSTAESREIYLGARATAADDVPSAAATGEDKHGFMTAYSFGYEYEGRLTGDNALLECRVSESVQHSGPRLVVRETPYGRDVIQECGIASGRREITAMAICASERVARVWVESQKGLGFSVEAEAPEARYWLPPRFNTNFNVLPRTMLIARGEGMNCRWIQVEGVFAEILPEWDFVETEAEAP